MLKPFQIVWELLVFGLQAIFLYGLAIILCVGMIAYVIADNKKIKQRIEYIYEKVIIEKKKESTIQQKKCTRIAGCIVRKDGTIEW